MPIPLFGFVLAFALLIAEQLFPFRAPPGGARPRLYAMTKHFALAGLSFLVARALGLGVAWLAERVTPLYRPVFPSEWARLAFHFVVLDLWLYAWHRAVHVWPFAWRFHQVHHMDELIDGTTALRFHAGDVALGTISRAVVILALGIPLYDVFLFEGWMVAAAIFHHANLRLPRALDGALSFVLVTPSFHRVHHHPMRAVHDANYATVFAGWDRLFGTYIEPARAEDRPPGLGRKDEGFVGLLVAPFRGPRAETDAASTCNDATSPRNDGMSTRRGATSPLPARGHVPL
jgi:sterol desaturase/sphingolipid hydroxylase (fatty acid hydroxylase superfamily)